MNAGDSPMTKKSVSRLARFAPGLPAALAAPIAGATAGLALVSFSSMMLTDRSFAAKNRYQIDADREFDALGAANVATALSQGFAISGADSRTAVADATGGRTQMTGLVAAAAVALVLLFLPRPLQYVPIAALGAVLVKASLSLLDVRTLSRLYRLRRSEFALSLPATFGVISVGAIQAIGVAAVLVVLRFVSLSAKPRVEILGKVDGMSGFHSTVRHSEAGILSRFGAFPFQWSADLLQYSIFQTTEPGGDRCRRPRPEMGRAGCNASYPNWM